VITLAVATGVSAREWGREGFRGIATAMEVLAELNGHKPADGEDQSNQDGPKYSG
jgi:hypothetical protein